MADERAHPTNDPRDELIRRSDEELARLRDELAQTGHERDRFKRERDRWKRERDRLKRQNERLTQLLGAARRAGFQRWTPSAGQVIGAAKWNLLQYSPVEMRGAEDDKKETTESFSGVEGEGGVGGSARRAYFG